MDGTDGKGQQEALRTKFADQKARVTPAEEDIILWSETSGGGGAGAWDSDLFTLAFTLPVVLSQTRLLWAQMAI